MKRLSTGRTIRHQARIGRQLASAVQALRTADAKLGQAATVFRREFGATDGTLELADLWEARYSARLFAEWLEEAEEPSLPRRAFRALANHVNQNAANPAHLEGAILALALAERSLESALELAGQLNGGAIGGPYRLAYAARAAIRSFATFLYCAAMSFDLDAALDEIAAAPADSLKLALVSA